MPLLTKPMLTIHTDPGDVPAHEIFAFWLYACQMGNTGKHVTAVDVSIVIEVRLHV